MLIIPFSYSFPNLGRVKYFRVHVKIRIRAQRCRSCGNFPRRREKRLFFFYVDMWKSEEIRVEFLVYRENSGEI